MSSAISSRSDSRNAASSSSLTMLPSAAIRSFAPIVSSSGANKGFFTNVTQPPRPPGQNERATWSVSSKPDVVMRPTLAPRPVRTALVATVVPCITNLISAGSMPDESQIFATPFSTPIDESSGVDGTFAVLVSPVSSFSRRKSVNVPPTSTPRRYDMLFVLLSRYSVGDFLPVICKPIMRTAALLSAHHLSQTLDTLQKCLQVDAGRKP